jgi:hypothetical protein
LPTSSSNAYGISIYDNLSGAEFFHFVMEVTAGVAIGVLSSLEVFQTFSYTGTASMAFW